MGVLTKEFAVLVTLLPLVVLAWRRWEISRREAGLVGVLTCLPFGLWMLIVFASGHGDDFTREVSTGFDRVSGAEQVTGFNSPNAPSFTSTLLSNGAQFWTTYLVLGLGCIAALLLFRSRRPEHQVVVAFLGGAVPMLAYGVVAGANEEQFFNFLWVPAILAVAVWSSDRRAKLHAKRWLVIPLVALAVVSYFGNWGVNHFTRADGSQQVDAWMTANVPPGTGVGVTNSVQREIFTRYRMVDDRSATSLDNSGARYLVVFHRQIDQGYGFLPSTDLDRQVAGLTPAYSKTTRGNGRIEVYALR